MPDKLRLKATALRHAAADPAVDGSLVDLMIETADEMEAAAADEEKTRLMKASLELPPPG